VRTRSPRLSGAVHETTGRILGAAA